MILRRDFVKKFIFIGGFLFTLAVGFILGQTFLVSTGKVVFFETDNMVAAVKFKPGSDDLMRDLGSASLRFYLDALSACLGEPEKVDKITSTQVLSDFVFGSCMVNMVSPKARSKEKKTTDENRIKRIPSETMESFSQVPRKDSPGLF